jgi:hypothetical protein
MLTQVFGFQYVARRSNQIKPTRLRQKLWRGKWWRGNKVKQSESSHKKYATVRHT